MRRDPLIVGAGPAGSAAAIVLGLAGRHPGLIERSRGPADKVCGDFLGADAIGHLRALGVDPAGLGAAPIRRLRLLHRDRTSETELPFRAFGLSRRLLDTALLRRAEAVGARLHLGRTVRQITPAPDGWQVRLSAQPPLLAGQVFLATGKHDLRDFPRPGAADGAVGLKMYYRLSLARTHDLAGSTALLLFPGGYAGLQPVEAGRTVLCIALKRSSLRRFGGNWTSLLDALSAGSRPFRAMLADAEPLLPRPLAVAGIPYGFLHRQPSTDGLFRLGDQAAVIPSLTGDGIAIAVHSGRLAAQAWLDGAGAAAYHRTLADGLARQMRLAGMLHAAGMSGPLQALAIRGAAWFPTLLRHAARRTRLRDGPPAVGETPACVGSATDHPVSL